MVREFEEKHEWALILGASSGLGLATARKLAAHGLNLCLLYRARKGDLTAIEHEFDLIMNKHKIQLEHFNMDVVKEETRIHVLDKMERLLSETGKIKAVVHSIAKGNLKPMVSRDQKELQNDDFHLTLENMAISLYDWTKAVFSRNLFSSDARIISFTSEGNTKAWINYAAVSAAKAVLEATYERIKKIVEQIDVTLMQHTSSLETKGMKGLDSLEKKMIRAEKRKFSDQQNQLSKPGSDTLKEYALLRNPSKRLTTPEDVADVVYLLLRDEARWITGTTIPVDGGEHLS